MDLQAYNRRHFAKRNIVFVGNAPFSGDQSQRIDANDIFVRFNFFGRNGLEDSPCGRKCAYWFVNLDTTGYFRNQSA